MTCCAAARERGAAHRVPWLALGIFLAAWVLAAAPGQASDNSTEDTRRYEPLSVGELAPNFTLQDQHERPHTLSAERGRRPVVLVFYRGHW